MTIKKKRQAKGPRDFQKEYGKLVRLIPVPVATPIQLKDLRQPPFLTVVDSVTTYGAYEEVL